MNKIIQIDSDTIAYKHKTDSIINDTLNESHSHDNYEILFVTEGKGKYHVEGAEINMLPRSLIIVKPYKFHNVEIEEKGVYERYVVNFSLSALSDELSKILEGIIGEDDSFGRFFASDSLSQSIVSVFDRFELALGLPEKERFILMKLLLSELLVFLSGAASQRIALDEEELGAKVTRYINDYLEMDISLDKLAKYFFVSKYYLCRSFKKYSGVSIHSYINRKRIIYAKQLIDSGETASGAAYRVGFGDYSAFYRAYVKIFGKAPSHKT